MRSRWFITGLCPSAYRDVISLSEREASKAFDWRYYLVKYPSMRDGATGIYYGVDGKLGYSMCMLRTRQRNGYYRDPVPLEVWRSSGVGERVQDPWSTGYETSPAGCGWCRAVSACGAQATASHSKVPRTRPSSQSSSRSAATGLSSAWPSYVTWRRPVRSRPVPPVTCRRAAQTGCTADGAHDRYVEASAFPPVAPCSGCAHCTRQKHCCQRTQAVQSLRDSTPGRTVTTRRASSEQPRREDDLGYLQI